MQTSWLTQSIFSFIVFGLLFTMLPFVEKNYGIKIMTSFSLYYLGLTIGFLIFLGIKKEIVFSSIAIIPYVLIVLIGGSLGVFGNIAFSNSMSLAASKGLNTGIVIAIVGANFILVYFLNYVGYKLFPANFNEVTFSFKHLIYFSAVIFGMWGLSKG